jgi:hypothetical protein
MYTDVGFKMWEITYRGSESQCNFIFPQYSSFVTILYIGELLPSWSTAPVKFWIM